MAVSKNPRIAIRILGSVFAVEARMAVDTWTTFGMSIVEDRCWIE